MALDVTAERLGAANDIRNVPAALLSVRQVTYTGEVRTGQADVQTWALIESTYPRPLIEEMLVGTELELTMAGLVWDAAAGTWGAVLDLKMGDLVSINGKWYTVFLPGIVQPNGQAILYEPVVGLRKGRA